MEYSWKRKRDQLIKLIKKISEQHGGDDPAWLADYTGDIVFDHSENLDIPLACFALLVW